MRKALFLAKVLLFVFLLHVVEGAKKKKVADEPRFTVYLIVTPNCQSCDEIIGSIRSFQNNVDLPISLRTLKLSDELPVILQPNATYIKKRGAKDVFPLIYFALGDYDAPIKYDGKLDTTILNYLKISTTLNHKAELPSSVRILESKSEKRAWLKNIPFHPHILLCSNDKAVIRTFASISRVLNHKADMAIINKEKLAKAAKCSGIEIHKFGEKVRKLKKVSVGSLMTYMVVHSKTKFTELSSLNMNSFFEYTRTKLLVLTQDDSNKNRAFLKSFSEQVIPKFKEYDIEYVSIMATAFPDLIEHFRTKNMPAIFGIRVEEGRPKDYHFPYDTPMNTDSIVEWIEEFLEGSLVKSEDPDVEEGESMLKKLTYNEWTNEVVESNKDVVVVFHRDGCPHCDKLLPQMDAVKMLFGNITEEIELRKYNVMHNEIPDVVELQGVPQIFLFQKGKKGLDPIKFEDVRDLRNIIRFIMDNAQTEIDPQIRAAIEKMMVDVDEGHKEEL